MIGRRVSVDGRTGRVRQWEPLGSAMTDALVAFDDGSLCWYASYGLVPADGVGPLPSRRAARERTDQQLLGSLERIREQHVQDWHRRWPGVEFGKAILGRSLDGAIADVAARVASANRRP